MKKLLLFLAASGLSAGYSFSQTTIADKTNVTGTWTKAGSPYIVNGLATVPQGSTLTIEPGVEVRFKTGTDFNFSDNVADVGVLYIKGKLVAEGTAADRIIFTRDGSSGNWGCIAFEKNSAISTIAFSRIEFGRYAQQLDGSYYNAAISMNNEKVIILNSEVINNNHFGIIAEYSTLELRNSVVAYNMQNGIYIHSPFKSTDTIKIYNNTIAYNKLTGMECWNATSKLTNNIFWQNRQSITINNNYSYISYCLFPEDTLSYWTNKILDGVLFNTDPQIDTDFLLKSTSPCINRGTPDTLKLKLGNSDLHGKSRVNLGRVDIGANESTAIKYISISYPKGKEGFMPGREITVRWTSNVQNIKIEFTSDSGTTWNIITSSTNNDGEFKYTIPSLLSQQFNIRVSDVSDATINDICDNDLRVFQSEIPDGTRISGLLPKLYSPYLINGLAVVPFGDSLTIEPGVEIRFKTGDDNNYSDNIADVGTLLVKGKLKAEGTSLQRIIFTREGSSGKWGCIAFEKLARISSISYSRIEYANFVQQLEGNYYNGAISMNNEKVRILYSEIINNFHFGIYANYSTLEIRNSVIAGNNQNGIYIFSPFKSGDLIYVINNTIASNKMTGFECWNATSYLINNIFWGNMTSIDVKNNNCYISYCLIKEKELSYWTNKVGKGLIYDLNPQFINEISGDFHLMQTSPGIDSGDPSYQYLNEQTDNGGRIDLGAYGNTPEALPGRSLPSITYISKRSGRIFGNDTLTIKGNNLLSSRGTGKVKFLGTEALAYLDWNSDSIICITPPHKTGWHSIFITNNEGKTGFGYNCFNFTPPEVDKLNPLFSITSGNKQIKFTGNLFGEQRNGNKILFGHAESLAYSQWTDTAVIVNNPSGISGLTDITFSANDSVKYSYKNSFLYTDEVVTELCGTLPDVLQQGKNYLVTCPVTVASGKSLTVEPDVAVMVKHVKGSEISMKADGIIVSNATEQNPSIFTSIPQYPGYWKGLELNSGGTFNYTSICGAIDGLTHRSGTLTVTNSDFSNNLNTGIRITGDETSSTSTITNSSFSGNKTGIDVFTDCNQNGGSANVTVEESDFSQNTESAVKMYATGSTYGYSIPITRSSAITFKLINSRIFNNQGTAINMESFGYIDYDYIPSAHRYGNVTFISENSLIYSNGNGINALRKNTTHCTMKVRLANTVLYNNRLSLNMDAGEMFVYNTSLWDNGVSIGFNGVADQLDVKYSNLNSNIFQSNNNNISVNPGFLSASSGDFRLQATSPLIDKGSNEFVTFATDYDGKARIIDSDGDGIPVIDIGAFEAGTATLMADPLSINLHYSAGSNAVITITSNLLWTASSNQSWLTLSSSTGSANGSLTVTASANNATSARTAIVTINGGGSSTKTITVTQAALSVGIDDPAVTKIALYPNPVTDKLTISGTGLLSEPRIVVYSSTGTVIIDKKLHEESTEIDMHQLRAGIYLIRILSGNRLIETRNIIKI